MTFPDLHILNVLTLQLGLNSFCNGHLIFLIAESKSEFHVFVRVATLHLLILCQYLIIVEIILEAKGLSLPILRKIQIAL
jgi:hypothetical protein